MAASLVYGIDVGTTKIVALAGRVDPRRGWVEVLSMGEAPCYGLKRGVVVDRQAASESIAEAIEACGVIGGRVTVGIAGSHISSFNKEVTLLNRSRNLTVTDRFVRRLEQEARQLDLDDDEEVIPGRLARADRVLEVTAARVSSGAPAIIDSSQTHGSARALDTAARSERRRLVEHRSD